MGTVDWLPPQPLPIAKCREYKRTFEHITAYGPLTGVTPTPRETVVLLYFGIHDTTLYTAFDPAREIWVAIESEPASAVIPQTERILTEAMSFLEEQFPDDTFALLKRVDPARN